MKTFLTAHWKNLVMVNYQAEPATLASYLPKGTELDDWNGNCYVSLVAFMFSNTKVKGLSIPFYKNFEEVNLRFYVRRKENGIWKRGVVFIKELVPKKMICAVANTLYNEHYFYARMKNHVLESNDTLEVKYEWQHCNEWNFIRVVADKNGVPIKENSKEEFITEHYWGYSKTGFDKTSEYQVLHSKWNVHTVHEYELNCNAEKLYGDNFKECMQQTPASVFMAEGSDVKVYKRKILKY